MRPAFKYYGGKQRIASKIIRLIPKHTVYVEPFAGAAAVFFKKPWPGVKNNNNYREVLNDTNGDIINFFRVLQDETLSEKLIRRLQVTPYSYDEYRKAKLSESPDSVDRAWAFFVNINKSFAGNIGAGWGFAKLKCNPAATWIKRVANLPEVVERLHGVYIENVDALECIKKWDSPHTFFYCDPPYPGTHQGHYGGYTLGAFQALVNTLDQAQGSFILSNYDQPDATIPGGWVRHEIKTVMCAAGTSRKAGETKRTEILWRRFNQVPVRKDIKALYDKGKFDCFSSQQQLSIVPKR